MSDSTPPVAPYYERALPVDVYLVRPQVRPRYWLHILLLVVTFLSMLVVGARLQFNFANNLPAFALQDGTPSMFPLMWAIAQPARLLMGVPFAFTLMLILFAHEMGHYLYCIRYDVDATLPYFIPFPSPIGTLGAFIRIRSAIRSRAALFDIGIAGPIAGFIVAVVVLWFALFFSKPLPGANSGDLVLGYPLIFHFIQRVVPNAAGTSLNDLALHPIGIAAWVGMFATSLNLLPGGQLDGGHIVFALAPRAHKHISRLSIGALLPMGLFLWPGWFIWALLLAITGMRHPQVPARPGLNAPRKSFGVIALAMLLVTFIPAPFYSPLVDVTRLPWHLF